LHRQEEKLAELQDYMNQSQKNNHSSGSALIILKDNEVMYESYKGTHHFQKGARGVDASSQFNVYSVRVTYIALAAAIAIHEGKLGLDDELKEFFPDKDSTILANTSLRHLLTRSTGLQFNKNEIIRREESGVFVEGKRPDILSYILYQTTGKTVAQIINQSIIEPLKWKETQWMTTGKTTLVSDITSINGYPSIRLGSDVGDDRNLFVSARELALWGNLHLYKGKVDGVQVIPEEIFNLTTTIQSPVTINEIYPAFGFYWWIQSNHHISWEKNELGDRLPEGSFQLLGASGCSCTVIPKHNVVAVRMLNSITPNNETNYDYLKDIRQFGNMISDLL